MESIKETEKLLRSIFQRYYEISATMTGVFKMSQSAGSLHIHNVDEKGYFPYLIMKFLIDEKLDFYIIGENIRVICK